MKVTKIELNSDFLSHLNEPQIESLKMIIPQLYAAHFTNIVIRLNGENVEWQGDWIKHIFKNPYQE